MYRRIRDLREDSDLFQKDLGRVFTVFTGLLFPL